MNTAITATNRDLILAGPLGSLDAYIQAVGSVPSLSEEEERELATRLREDGDLDAARQLVLAHLRFVVHIASGYQGYGLPMADLIQDDDVVLFEKRPPYRSGEICAVRVQDSDVTLKYLDDLGEGRYVLRPHNPDYPAVETSAAELTIEGVYLGLLRGDAFRSLIQSVE